MSNKVYNYFAKVEDSILIKAIKQNKPLISLEKIIQKNPDLINSRGMLGNTALNVAVKNNSQEIIKMLLENGADPNIANNLPNSPLIWSVKAKRSISIVELLLQYKADVNFIGHLNKTALTWAKIHEREDIIELLLKYGADPDLADPNTLDEEEETSTIILNQKDRIPPGQHLVKNFPVLTYGGTPSINIDNWELNVWGKVKKTKFNWSDFMNLPHHEFTEDFHCVSKWSKLDVKWSGVKISDFMFLVTLDSDVTDVLIHCYGGYTTNLTLEDFLHKNNFFADQLFGKPLPLKHGYPLRLVVPHLYAWKSAKWVSGIEFLDHEKLGFWEQNRYHKRGDPWTEERYI
jgi:DMSO/TMAO reductase YedYZ molybdopterin-dependent catalytic subunit